MCIESEEYQFPLKIFIKLKCNKLTDVKIQTHLMQVQPAGCTSFIDPLKFLAV